MVVVGTEGTVQLAVRYQGSLVGMSTGGNKG